MRLLLVSVSLLACDPAGQPTPCERFRVSLCERPIQCGTAVPGADVDTCVAEVAEERDLWRCEAEADALDWSECLELVEKASCDIPSLTWFDQVDAACFFEVQGLPVPE